MTSLLLRVAALTVVYLLCLTSLAPGDIVVGIVLSVALVAGGRRIRPAGPPPSVTLAGRLAGVPGLVGGTVLDLAGSTWRTVAWCLHPRPSPAGLVTVPIPPCGPSSGAAWGVRVGITPDTVVVQLDEEQGQMLLHVLDSRDPDAVRADQLASYQRRQRRVFP
jgi:multisubunit Na+/H+ antiporter MnhE subunit